MARETGLLVCFGGAAYGYGCVHNIGFAGRRMPPFKIGVLAKGENAVSSFIPVACIADMLLHPGQKYDFNGRRLTYPEIDLVYWAGGNPFHHHQDLNRLRQAWSRPATVIVNEPFWTATARHADIVFPCTSPLERNDLSINGQGCFMSPMRQAVDPFGDARNDYDVFRGLAALLDTETAFSEGRDEMQWLEHLYGITRANAESAGITLPDFPAFWAGEQFSIEDQVADRAFMLERFREDPRPTCAAHAFGEDRALLRDNRGVRLRRLPRTPAVVRQAGVAGRTAGRRIPAAPDLESAADPPAQSIGSRYDQPTREDKGS